MVYNGITLRSIPLYTNAKTTKCSRKMCQVILTRSFPQKLAAKEDDKDLDPKLDDEDRIAVEKIFKTMASAISIANKPMQIIVLEHADESVWGKVERVHKVCEWRGENQKLIPEEWIE